MRGEMKAICSKTDRTVPICRGLCETTIRQERVIVPLAGGRQAFEPAQTTNPCPGGLTTQDLNLDTNPNGTVLGTELALWQHRVEPVLRQRPLSHEKAPRGGCRRG